MTVHITYRYFHTVFSIMVQAHGCMALSIGSHTIATELAMMRLISQLISAIELASYVKL